MTEYEKMIAGDDYDPQDPQLVQMRRNSREKTKLLSDSLDKEEINNILKSYLKKVGEHITVEPPFICDYGSQVSIGDRVFINFNCIILDCAPVTIGDDTFFAPNVQLYAATHPIDPIKRSSGIEFAQAIHIGNRCWLGGGVIVCPGVTIGDNVVIGAGSVVTKDIPGNSVAVGNPCRVVRTIDQSL